MAETKPTATKVAKTDEVADNRVDLFIPRDSGNSEPVFISINGINYRLPRGKTSRVPKVVADIYKQMQEAEEKFYHNHNKESEH